MTPRPHYTRVRRAAGLGLVFLLLSMGSACMPTDSLGSRSPQPAASTGPAPAALVPKGDPAPRPPSLEEISNDQLLALALDQRASGEPAGMAATLDALLARGPDAVLHRRASFYLAEARLLGGDTGGAAEAFRAFIAAGPDDEWTGRAVFLLARTYEQAGLHREAIDTYHDYRARNTVVAPYAAQREAAQHATVGDPAAMLAAYEAAGAEQIAPSQRAEIFETLVRHYGEQGRPDLQLARLRDLLLLARKPDYRAGLLLRAAAVAAETGDAAARLGWLRELVEKYPEAAEAPAAAGLLAEAGTPIAPYTAGRIAFLHEQYDEAIGHLDAALAGELMDTDREEARRLRALALRATGAIEEAQAELGALAGGGGDSPARRQTELDYVQTVGHSGNRDWAIDGYRRFAATYPQDPLTPEALWRAIQLQEEVDPEAAMQAALDLGRLFGSTEQAHAALARAATYFRDHERLPEAITAWGLLGEGAKGWDSAEGHFWAAMTLLEGGDRAGGLEQMQAAIAAAPETYYAARAREFLGKDAGGTAPLGGALDHEQWQQAAAWIGDWTARAPVEDAQAALAELAATAEVARGRELGILGLGNEAQAEWLAAVERFTEDPERLWYLGTLAVAENQAYVAIKAGERLVVLSPAGRIAPDTPAGVLRLLFPTPFARVARQEAEQAGLDPRLLFAVMRQESLFSPTATSWVGARGLAQVMPATADGIATQLGIVGFDPDELYRPAVGLRFGAFYLGRQMSAFNNNIQAAAAAYNGGPGNAQRWLEVSNHPDRFTELIDYRETREYVKIVYGNWGMYRMLYGR